MQRLLLVSAFMAISGWAYAEDTVTYTEVGAWTIAVDTTLGDGCFAYADFEGGSALRIGLNNTEDSFYVMMRNEDWKSIEYGKKYEIEIRFGNLDPWTGRAEGFSFDPPNNEPVLQMIISNDGLEEFLTEFMQESSVQTYYENQEILNLSLRDSFQAALQLAECQESVDMWTKDPFGDTPTRDQADPFR